MFTKLCLQNYVYKITFIKLRLQNFVYKILTRSNSYHFICLTCGTEPFFVLCDVLCVNQFFSSLSGR